MASSVVVSGCAATEPKPKPDPPSNASSGRATPLSHVEMDCTPSPSYKPDRYGDYRIPDHVGNKNFPTMPGCPGPDALGPNDIITRPRASEQLQDHAPQLMNSCNHFQCTELSGTTHPVTTQTEHSGMGE